MKCLSRVVMSVIALSAVMVSCNLDPIECPDKTNCNGVCADLQEDNANCGTCGNVCKDGEKCKSGACRISCPDGQIICGSACADLTNDINHCGKCGHVCDDGEKCDAGECVISCGSGQIECNGGCVDTKIDINHCGECGHACQEGEKCDAGVCVISCPESQTVCENHCFNLNESEEHCGSCEIACNSGERCIDGACKCQADFEYCNSKCVNLSKIKMVNCSDCEAGYLDCDDNRENGCELFFNVENCGSCGHKCKDGEFCSNGTCVLSCQDGEIECDGKCINLSGSMNMRDCSTCKEGYCDADNNLNNGCEANINGSDIENC
ncbi:MAG: hypothetical protein II180_12280, partial [Proteobacteria bacterium]|nr:hypothetical protein [Pseudomonadota bacterium]